MKMTVIVIFCIFSIAFANPTDPPQIEKYGENVKTYRLEVPGKKPITIIEAEPTNDVQKKWEDISLEASAEKDDVEMKNLMTHIIHDVNDDSPRCYGPSCQDGFNPDEGPQADFDEDLFDSDKGKDYRDFSIDRLQAISALAAKLKKDKLVQDRYSSMNNHQTGDEDSKKVFTSWNRLKVKQHKHPYDDKDGWVTMEPVAWSTSKISKWKPNVKKQKPNHWNDDDERYPTDDPYASYQGMDNTYSFPQKKPTMPTTVNRPGFINNKFHVPYDTEMPSKPTWTKPQQTSYPSSWSPDEGRRPHKPHCDSQENYPEDDTVFYGISDSVVTDNRPPNFPYEYEALHQAAAHPHRPMRRPTQVVYSGPVEYDSDRGSRPPYGDGQWVLLSTTKGYRNKKRQRSLTPPADDRSDYGSVTSHQAVALTVLPVDDDHTNMTTSHGGLLEVERSFQTVEESKRDLDKKNDVTVSASNNRPFFKRFVNRRVISNSPDTSTLLAAVGAGMVPATMAMVVPMMLGRRRRRDLNETPGHLHLNNVFYRYE